MFSSASALADATTERLYKRENDFDAMTAIRHAAARPPSRPRFRRTSTRSPAPPVEGHGEDASALGDELVDAIEEAAGGAMFFSSALGRFLRELFGAASSRGSRWTRRPSRRSGSP